MILSEKCRLIYNFALEERIKNWEENHEKSTEERSYITYIDQQNALPTIKKRYPEYSWVYSKVLQMVLKRLDNDFKSFLSLRNGGKKNARPPRFKGKEYFTALTFNQSGFKLDTKKQTISFSHKYPSGTELKFHLPWIPQFEGVIKQAEIYQDNMKRWFILLAIEVKEPTYTDNGLYQAIDLGIINLVTAVNIHGRFIQIRNRRPDLYWRNKIREVQSRRDRCRKLSNKWYFFDKKLRKMKRKLANQLLDFQHKISKRVVENTRANMIIIGALSVKRMIRRTKRTTGISCQLNAQKTLNHSLVNTGFMGRFAKFLTYKAQKIGKRVTRIDESYTSKTCCICGKVNTRKLSERFIICDCGNHLDRDMNSAVNIMLRFLSHKPPVNGEPLQVFLNGLHRNTALPKIQWAVDSMRTTAIT